MEVQFVDRILICSDCHSEFIFTAGEQLFFHDKQFKNDPKRCKPCKSKRSAPSPGGPTTGPAAAGLSRTETRTECSECGVQTTVPFKPTQGRPVLCRQCFQAKNKVAATTPVAKSAPARSAPANLTPVETASALSSASVEPNGAKIASDAATGAAASISSASPESSVASAADLASISAHQPVHNASQIPTELLAAAAHEVPPPDQISASLEAPEA